MESQRNRINPILLLLIVPLSGVVGGLLLLVASGTFDPPPTPAPITQPESRLMGRAAPNFELPTLEGDTMRLSSLRGRVVFINFWATWCEPCRRELPAFQQFMNRQPEGGPIIIAVNAGETVEQIVPFLQENNVGGIPILLDTDFRINRAYDADFLPITYVVDPAGIVRNRHLGEMTLEQLNDFVRAYDGS